MARVKIRRVLAAFVVVLLVASACSGSDSEKAEEQFDGGVIDGFTEQDDAEKQTATKKETGEVVPNLDQIYERKPLAEPQLTGSATLGPASYPAMTDESQNPAPAIAPTQVGAPLRGSAIATNQWWSSALTGPGTLNIWTQPLTVKVNHDKGIEIQAPVMEPLDVPDGKKAIVSKITDIPLTLYTKISDTKVVDYDDFSVQLAMQTDNGDMSMRLVQGSPAVTLQVPQGPLVIETNKAESASVSGGRSFTVTDIGERRWTVIASADVRWNASGTQVTGTANAGTTVTFVYTPSDADTATWEPIAQGLATSPISGTKSAMVADWDNGVVRQTLQWQGAGQNNVVALLPHQFNQLDPKPQSLGTFQTSRGLLHFVQASEVTFAVPLAGFLPGVPESDFDEATKTKLQADFASFSTEIVFDDSYFGSKELAKIANVVEAGNRLGVDNSEAEKLLLNEVKDHLHYSGPQDRTWVTYDKTWGGVIIAPASFGSREYNDHHFHYGYVVHAAAVAAEIDPTFVAEYGDMVDLLVDNYMGAPANASVPEFRAFNAYVGHSYAAGAAPFDAGNNQESSSEAVNAWWAATRWAIASDNQAMAEKAVARYAMESFTARAYWLEEIDGYEKHPDYKHSTAGILWDAKVDFATWFDAKASAAIGIQLIPTHFGAIYRSDAEAAKARSQDPLNHQLDTAEGIWKPDLFAMDYALYDADAAMEQLDAATEVDDGNTREFASYWIASLGSLGTPSSTITVDSLYGAAFEDGDNVAYVGINPTKQDVEVGFMKDGKEVERLTLEPGESKVSRG